MVPPSDPNSLDRCSVRIVRIVRLDKNSRILTNYITRILRVAERNFNFS